MNHQQALASDEIGQMIRELEECLTAARLTKEGIADSDPSRIREGLDGLFSHIGYKGKLIIGAGLLSSGATDETALFLDDLKSPEARYEAYIDDRVDRERIEKAMGL